MAKTRLSFKPFRRYDAEDRDIGEQPNLGELDLTRASATYSTLVALLNGFHDRHEAFIANAVKDIEENYLQALADQVTVTLKNFLFPPSFTQLVQEKYYPQGGDLFEEIIKLTTQAIQDDDQDTLALLTNIGQYFQSKLIEVPWHIPVSRKIALLPLLANSAQDFLSAATDQDISYDFAEINKIKKDYPDELDQENTNVDEKIRKYVDKVETTYSRLQARHDRIGNQILQLEKKRQSSWLRKIFPFWFRWFGDSNLETQARLQSKQTVITKVQSQIDILRKGNKTSSYYATIAAIALAQKDIDTLQIKLLNGSISKEEISALVSAVNVLLANEDHQEKANAFFITLKAHIKNSFSYLDKPSSLTNDLALNDAIKKLRKCFEFIAAGTSDVFVETSEFVLSTVRDKLKDETDPAIAERFIANLEKLDLTFNPEITVELNKLKEKFQDWIEINKIVNKIANNTVVANDIHRLYAKFVSLREDVCSVHMKKAAEAAVQYAKEVILAYLFKIWDDKEPTQQEENIARTCLQLFVKDKTTVPDAAFALRAVSEGREAIVKDILNTLSGQKITNVAALDRYISRLQKIWPEALEPQYIELHNTTETDIKLPPAGALLSALPSGIVPDCAAQNYTLSIGEVTLHAGEKRIFWCVPQLDDGKIKAAIEQKYCELFPEINETMEKVSRVREKIATPLALLTGKETFLQKAWRAITGQTNIPLTAKNIKFYVNNVVDPYFEAISEFPKDSPQAKCAQKKMVQDFEAIAISFDRDLENLLGLPVSGGLQKLANDELKPDLAKLLIKWWLIHFIREKLSKNQDVCQLYQHVCVGSIYKMDELAKEEPGFIHEILGNMTAEHLNALNATFVAGPGLDSDDGDYRKTFELDLIGEKQTIGSSGQTALRKSMLLSQVSALVIQELVTYLNRIPEQQQAGMSRRELKNIGNTTDFDMNLFREHVRFVCEHLPTQRECNQVLNEGILGLTLRGDLKKYLYLALDTETKKFANISNDNLVNDIYSAAIIKLQIIRDFLRNEEAKNQFIHRVGLKGEDLLSFNEKIARVVDSPDKKRSLNQVINGVPLINLDGCVADLYDFCEQAEYKHAQQSYADKLKRTEEAFNRKFNGPAKPDSVALQNYEKEKLRLQNERDEKMPHLFEDICKVVNLLKAAYDKLDETDPKFDLANFIKTLPVEVVNSFPPDFAAIIRQIQYALADRFTSQLQKILGYENLKKTPGAHEKLLELKSTEFNGLVCLVFPKESDRESIFGCMGATQPKVISSISSSSGVVGSDDTKILGTGVPKRETSIFAIDSNAPTLFRPGSYHPQSVQGKTAMEVDRYLRGERETKETKLKSSRREQTWAAGDNVEVGIFGEALTLEEPIPFNRPGRT